MTEKTGVKPGKVNPLVRLGRSDLYQCAKCRHLARLRTDGCEYWVECYNEDPECDNVSDYGKSWDEARQLWNDAQIEIHESNDAKNEGLTTPERKL